MITTRPDGVVLLDGKEPLLDASLLDRFIAVVDRVKPAVVKAREHLSHVKNGRPTVPESWIYGIIWAETGFLGPDGGETAVSPAGAIGRMQLMPFWFTVPTAIGDGQPHTTDEMMHDA